MGSPCEVHLAYGPGQSIYVYQHSDGYEEDYVNKVAAAIAYARPNWGDAGYFTRMFIDHFIDDHDSSSGFGITPYPTDSMVKRITVMAETQCVGRGTGLVLHFSEFVQNPGLLQL